MAGSVVLQSVSTACRWAREDPHLCAKVVDHHRDALVGRGGRELGHDLDEALVGRMAGLLDEPHLQPQRVGVLGTCLGSLVAVRHFTLQARVHRFRRLLKLRLPGRAQQDAQQVCLAPTAWQDLVRAHPDLLALAVEAADAVVGCMSVCLIVKSQPRRWRPDQLDGYVAPHQPLQYYAKRLPIGALKLVWR